MNTQHRHHSEQPPGREQFPELEQRLGADVAGPAGPDWARLRAGLADQAAARGLLDVAYTTVDSPLGELLLAATPTGVVRLAFNGENRDQVLTELATRLSPRLLEQPARLDAARHQLDQYFTRDRTAFDLPLDWTLTSGFYRRVLGATAAIPYGHTGTYRSVATAAGSPNAVRAAGTALSTNPLPIIVPCHRVTRSDGTLGGYRGGPARKNVLLRHEAAHEQPA